MKTTLAFAAWLAIVPLVRAQDAKRAFEIADYYRTAFVGVPEVSPDGGLVAFSVRRYDFEGQATWSNIWVMAADGSNLRQMTTGKSSDGGPKFSPDGRTLLFSRGGQLWTIPVDGGDSRQLTDFPPGVSDPVWSPDGRFIAVSAEVYAECGADPDCNRERAEKAAKSKLAVHVADELLYRHWTSWRDGKYTHVLLLDAHSGEVLRDLTPGAWDSPTFSLGGDRGYAFAPDSSELCFVSNRDQNQAESTNADLWVVSLPGESGASSAATPRNLTAANHGWDGAPLYSPDGSRIAFISQATPRYESDLRRLAVLDRASGAVSYVTDRSNFDDMVDDVRWAPDGSALLFQGERHGRNPLFSVAAEGGEVHEVHRHASINGWELVGGTDSIVYTRRSVGEPHEIFRFDGEQPRRLTHFNAELEAEVDIRPVEELWVDGDGDTKVHVFLVKPHGFDPEKKYPLILNVHGGPQGQWTDGYRGDWQVYPGKGYVVAFPNPTGSTGYGQDFTDGIACDWGGRVYRDLMKVTDALEELPYVDANRMGAMGWSYGGYMMMWFQGHTDRFKAIAAMMGLFDLTSFYGATEELWFPEKDLCGTPWTSEHYRKWSPSQYVENFKTPSLIITGELDYRVPYTQSLMYFTALQKQSIPSRLIVFPGAGHWPGWREMTFYYNAHLDFFHEWLGGDPAPYDVLEHAAEGVPARVKSN